MMFSVVHEDQVRAVLARARAEGWRELALIRPGWGRYELQGCGYAETLIRRGWPADRVFVVTGLPPGWVDEVAALTSLTALDLRNCEADVDDVRRLTALSGLRSLGLGFNPVGGEAFVRVLATLPELTALDLSLTKITSDTIRALASLTRLEALELTMC
ncbi:MAG TPA: hypothetical protein VIK91_16320, partial [Nannocystis sp.]